MRRNNVKKNNNTKFYALVGIIVLVIIVLLILIINNNESEPNVKPYDENNVSQNNNNNTQADTNDEEQNNEQPKTEQNDFGVNFEVVDETVYTTITLNIRSKPGFDGEVLFAAELDSKLNRIGIGDNGWDKLKLDSGEIAFASSEYLTTKTPREGTTGEGLPIAESTGVSTSNTPVDTKHYTTNTLKDGVTEKQADSFFKDAVFYGDSVTLGFQNYVSKQSKDFLGGLTVYGMGSYGLGNALKAVSSSSIHPTYKGYQTQLWDLTKELKAKKVFMMFGMNDLGLYGVTDSITNYKTLINKIRAVNPGVEIYVLTTTPMTESYQLTYLNNSNIRLFNNKIRELCDEWDVTQIDVSSYLMDSNGYLQSKYASDGKYHLTEAAYKEWVKVLRSFASYNI
ncbi:MAG: hypothetical protein IKV94_04060 [Clostridia bacterium]|nr:hypothetical protein [Clostridia bacterium]